MDSIFGTRQGKIMFFIAALILIALAIGVARPYLNSVMLAVIVVYIVQPLYKVLLGKINPRKNRASIISTIIVIIFTLLILTLIIFTIIGIISLVITELNSLNIVNNPETDVLDEIITWLNDLFSDLKIPVVITVEQILTDIQSAIAGILSFLASSLASIGSASANAVVNVIVFFGLVVLFTPKFDDMLHLFRKISPFDSEITDLYFFRALETAKSMVWGLFIIALVQGGLAGLIFAILGLKNSLLLAVVVGVFSFLPLPGTGIVTLPIAAVMIFNGEYVKAIILIIFQLVVIGLTDPLLRSWLIPRQARMPLIVSLIAVLGGLAWMGIWGLIYGPVIFSLLIATFVLVKKHLFMKSRRQMWSSTLIRLRYLTKRMHKGEGWHIQAVHPAHSGVAVKPRHVRVNRAGVKYRRILKRYILNKRRVREKRVRHPWSCESRRR